MQQKTKYYKIQFAVIMKDFFKFTLATICGIILLSVVSGILFMISIVGMIASESGSTKVEENSVFVIKLNGMVQERSMEDDPFTSLLNKNDMENMGLDDLVASIKKAKENDNIKGIYIEGGVAAFDAPATAQQLRDALADFKSSGKWIIAYADQYMQASYYVVSVADSIFLNKTGMIDFRGLGGKNAYMTGLYEKIGVKYQATRVGKYKSAVESVTRKDMSEDDREQRTAYLQGIWQHMLKDMADSRKVKPEQLDQLASDSIIAFASTDDYMKAKLIDGVMYPDEIKKVVKGKLGIDDDDDEINQILLGDMLNVKSKKKEKGDKIAIYYAYGEIVDQMASGFSTNQSIVGSTTVEDLNELAEDDDVKAVVMRVNSPGGSAVASEQIWHAVQKLKEKKPVVVSMGGLAASGGYMISAGANYIFAEPTTITGSIGIFGLIPNLSGLVTDKLGVTFDGVTTNRYGDFEYKLMMDKENSEEIRNMQNYVDRGYETFLDIVAKGRSMKRDEVHEIAQGRVWLAVDALPIHLVDQLGSLDDAVKKAAELAKTEEYYTSVYPDKRDWMDDLFGDDNKGTYLDSELRAVLGDFYEPIMEMRLDQQRNCLQARFPYSVKMK